MRATIVGWLLATTLLSTACHSRKPVTLDELTGLRPVKVWATRGDQSVVLVTGPQVYGNKLVGFVDGKYREMPAADLKQLIMQVPARGRTTALVVAGALGIVAFAVLATGSGDYVNPCDTGSSECFPM
jgi:hypothetical protein